MHAFYFMFNIFKIFSKDQSASNIELVLDDRVVKNQLENVTLLVTF